jgi:hypothetical protein
MNCDFPRTSSSPGLSPLPFLPSLCLDVRIYATACWGRLGGKVLPGGAQIVSAPAGAGRPSFVLACERHAPARADAAWLVVAGGLRWTYPAATGARTGRGPERGRGRNTAADAGAADASAANLTA